MSYIGGSLPGQERDEEYPQDVGKKTFQKGVASLRGQEEADICCFSRSSPARCDLRVRMWSQVASKVDLKSSHAVGDRKH